MVYARDLFPTSGAIDEERLIGRSEAVDTIVKRIASRRDTLIIEPRQVGKSSTLQAAIQRCRRNHNLVVAHCDLKIDGVQTSSRLAECLLVTAAETGAGDPAVLAARLRGAINRAGKKVSAPVDAVASAAETLGVPPELPAVATALTDIVKRGEVPLGRALAALEAGAQLRNQPTAVVIDEVQEIGGWGADGTGVEEALEAAARRKNRRLVFAFAGSEKHALETLFQKGRPLYAVSDRYPLPRISTEDWKTGLRARMAHGGCGIADDALDMLLAASKGHPLCTMHAAKETFLVATDEGAGSIEAVHVEAGLARARQQLFWKEFVGE